VVTQTVTGLVYEDNNADGLFNAGDTPLAGVQVKITASNGGVYLVTTDVNGQFSQAVPAGATTVDVVDSTLPAGSVLTSDAHNQGSDPTVVNVPAGGTATDNTGYTSAPPTAVSLAYFRAQSVGTNQVLLEWRTLVEFDALGFYVERQGAAGWERVTQQIIPALGQDLKPHI
jgi:hypothetical protein